MLIVTHMGRPSKTLKGLVFIFAGPLIRRVQGAAMRGNAPLAMGGTGLSVGGGAYPTVLDPSSTRCFSSFRLQISFQQGPPSSNPTKQIEFQSRSFFSQRSLSLVCTEQDVGAATTTGGSWQIQGALVRFRRSSQHLCG